MEKVSSNKKHMYIKPKLKSKPKKRLFYIIFKFKKATEILKTMPAQRVNILVSVWRVAFQKASHISGTKQSIKHILV